jgi:hypothetical protein
MAQQTDDIVDTNKMMTAVEFTVNEIKKMYKFHNGQLPIFYVLELLEQAKAMEKEQIIKAINTVSENNVKYANMIIASWSQIEGGELFMHNTKLAEQYYTETYSDGKKN